MVKIIIAHQNRIFSECVSNLLTIRNIAKVIAETSNGNELLNLLEIHQPDLILIDISMQNGIDTTKKALEKNPKLKVLTISSCEHEKHFSNIIEYGVNGFVSKSSGLNELENAIIEISKGGTWFSSEMIQKLISGLHSKSKDKTSELSKREIEIIKLICESLTNEQIAERINISVDTVKWHRANILSKTSSSNSAGLVIYAIKNRLIEI